MHTSPAQTETIAAARTLVQWARTYQAKWRPDATAGSLAAFEEPEPLESPMRRFAADPPGPAPQPTAPVPDPVPAAVEPPASAPVAVARNTAVSPKAKRRSLWVWAGAGAAAAVILMAVAAPVLLKPKIAAAPPEPTTGLMSLESTPAGATAFIDGVEAGQTPFVKEVPVGSHVVEFRRGKNARTLQLTVVGGTKVTGLVDWNQKPTGRLVIKSSAGDTAVLVDRKRRGMAPLTLDDLSVGRHTVTLQSSLGSLSRTVVIAEGKTVTVSEELAPGLLKVTAPPGVRVFEASDIIPLDDKRQALLPSGTHTLRFVDNATGASERRTVTINPNKVTEVSVTPTVVPSAPDMPSAPETPSPVEAVTDERP